MRMELPEVVNTAKRLLGVDHVEVDHRVHAHRDGVARQNLQLINLAVKLCHLYILNSRIMDPINRVHTHRDETVS